MSIKSFLAFVTEMTGRDIHKELNKQGYESYRNGKHQIWKHKELGTTVAVPNHPGDMPPGTARSILKTIGSRRKV